ncbi:MAG: thioredoxin family protein [Siphonobacter sp.]
MKKSALLTLTLLLTCLVAQAQETTKKVSIYDPKANAGEDIKNAVAKAAREKKNVLLQIGGNWCVWCIRFHNLVNSDSTLKSISDANFVTVHVNYSPENKNEKVLAQLGYPQRFGFPVFVILDEKGNRIHTQNSAYLEKDKGHDPKVVAEFLRQWSPAALDPKQYSK